MQFDVLMTTVEDAIKKLNLPWWTRQEDDSVIIEFDELDYVPDGTWGVGLWLRPDTTETLGDQIYSCGERDEHMIYDKGYFIDQMRSFREDGKDIPDDETLLADAKLIADHVDQFYDFVSEKEDQWTQDERQRAINLAVKVFDEGIDKTINPMFQFDETTLSDEPYDANDKGTYWKARFYYDYLGEEIYDDELAVLGTLDDVANASAWEPFELRFDLDTDIEDGVVNRFLGMRFLLPYKK